MKFVLLIVAAVAALAAGGVVEPEGRLDPFLDVTFYLYTRTNPDTPVQMWVGDLNGAAFDNSKPTKVLLHGYNANGNSDWVITARQAYLRVADVNVVVVDWGDQATSPLYNIVKDRVPEVGNYVGVFMNFLVLQGADSSTFHCVGHSLGAHGCGLAGRAMTTPLGRATGLDPTVTLYSYEVTTDRMTPDDAIFVDAIHTCAGFLGFDVGIAQADFWPNGGADQPGCGLDLTGVCRDARSHEYFTESIESSGFVSHECASWEDYDAGLCASTPLSLMGEPADPSLKGNFYLHTRRSPPFAQG